jgi:hypothetical protein
MRLQGRMRIVVAVICSIIILFGLYVLFVAEPIPPGPTYSSPEEIIQAVKVGDKFSIPGNSILGYVNQKEVDVTWSCEVKSSDLTECLWQSQKSPVKLLIAFPKSKGISLDSGNYYYVLLIEKQDNVLIAVAEKSFRLIL